MPQYTANPNIGSGNQKNVSATTVIKAKPGTVVSINVITAGSTAGSLNDCATTGAVAAGNKFFTVPAVVGPNPVNWNVSAGCVYTPGTGQVIAISYNGV